MHRFFVFAFCVFVSFSETYAQDAMPQHAPADHAIANIEAINLRHPAHAIYSGFSNVTISDIYTSWDNSAVSKVSGYMPVGFRVDLRGYCMPIQNRTITSRFGQRWGRAHKGLDVALHTGDTVCAAFDGKVRVCKYDAGGWGYYVLIRHPNGLETLYGHLSRQLVREDQIVKAGQPIGLGGSTGRSTGPHLHFETRLMGEAIDPTLMFDFVNQTVTSNYYIATKTIDKR